MDDKKLLIVDDEQGILQVYGNFFSKRGFDVITAENGAIALELLQKEHFPVAIVDISMPVMDGLTLAKEVKERDIDSSLVILTGHGEKSDAITAINCGAAGWFEKNDGDMEGLLSKVNELISVASIEFLGNILGNISDKEFENER